MSDTFSAAAERNLSHEVDYMEAIVALRDGLHADLRSKTSSTVVGHVRARTTDGSEFSFRTIGEVLRAIEFKNLSLETVETNLVRTERVSSGEIATTLVIILLIVKPMWATIKVSVVAPAKWIVSGLVASADRRLELLQPLWVSESLPARVAGPAAEQADGAHGLADSVPGARLSERVKNTLIDVVITGVFAIIVSVVTAIIVKALG